MPSNPKPESVAVLWKFRLVLGLFILALVASGVTAFPLERELQALVSMRGLEQASPSGGLSGLDSWIPTVRNGLRDVCQRYPWMAYGAFRSLPTISEALWPPKPKLFDIATEMARGRAWFGV
jgi:hypothetical protein